jgi:hypothetical protein
MALPPLTPRGFWTRIAVFGAALLVFVWAVLLMLRERILIGVALFSLLALFRLTQLILTAKRRPGRHDQ